MAALETQPAKLPLLGQIAAGAPLLAEENVEDEIAVPEPLGRGADFLLRVKGDSMIEAGILEGDTLVVHRQQEARNGEVVVALVGDDESANEATVKTFYRDERPCAAPAGEQLARAHLRRSRADPGQGDRRLPESPVSVAPLARTLDQELAALVRGASFECLVCGEFVMHLNGVIACPECRLAPRRGHCQTGCRDPRDRATLRSAGRVTAGLLLIERWAELEESPDTAGQDAGETPGGESRRKVAQKGDRRRATAGKGETVG